MITSGESYRFQGRITKPMIALTTAARRKFSLRGNRLASANDGATKLAIRLTAMVRISRARQASTSSGVFGIFCTTSVGLSIRVPSMASWPPARTTTMTPKISMLIGMPQKLPRTIACFDLAPRVKSQKLSTKVP